MSVVDINAAVVRHTSGMLEVLVSRRLGFIGTAHGLLARMLVSSMVSGSSSSAGRSRWRTIVLVGKHTIARGATATTVAAALATTAAATAGAVAAVKVDKRRHLTLSILQHGTVVVLEGDSRIRRPLGLNVVPMRGTSSS